MTRWSDGRAPALAALALAALAGCERHLMATPNLYAGRPEDPFAHVPESLRTDTVQVLYATDRAPDGRSKAGVTYGRGRAEHLAFGAATIRIGRGVSWPELTEASRAKRRTVPLPVAVTEVRELGRLPDPSALHAALAGCLAATDTKQVYLFVHGFSTSFEEGVDVIAQIWHFLGRTGVPVSYGWPSWPAEQGGLRSYAYDRESGEFTVGHLKRLLGVLASCPDVELVHVIAHSRGADIVMTALRELHLVLGPEPERSRSALKLGVVILAAPDVDADVVRQRVLEEGVDRVPTRLVVYHSPDDWALGLAGWMFGDTRRLGHAGPGERPVGGAIQFVECRVSGYSHNRHDYFYRDPAVSSDLILVLSGRLDPGHEHGRPLEFISGGRWRLTDDYPVP